MLLLASIALAACPASPDALEAEVRRVERAFAALDATGVAKAGAALEVETACAAAPIEARLAARMHAAAGFVAFVAGDTDRAAAAFAAARRVEPSWTPDPKLVPKGHPIHALAARLDPDNLGVERAPKPAKGTLYLDGQPSQDRPRDASTIAQWVVDDTVVSGAYVWPGAPLPPYDVAQTSAWKPRRSLGAWLGVTGASLAASATCFYVAGRARDAWANAETGQEVEARYVENHVLVGVGATFGVVAGVGGIGAVAALAF